MKTKISRFPALSLAAVAMLIILNAQLSTAVGQGAVLVSDPYASESLTV